MAGGLTVHVAVKLVQDITCKVEVDVTIRGLALLRVQWCIGVIALPGIRPINQTSTNSRQADHILPNIHVLILKTLSHVVQSVQCIKCNDAHEVLVLWARVTEDREEVVHRLSDSLVLSG